MEFQLPSFKNTDRLQQVHLPCMFPVLQVGNCKSQNDTIQDENVIAQCWQIV